MKKLLSLVTAFVMLCGLMGLATGAYFTDWDQTGEVEIFPQNQSCSLDVHPSNLTSITQLEPGKGQTYVLTVTNDGDIDARWRLGMRQSSNNHNSFSDYEGLLSHVNVTFYKDKDSCKKGSNSNVTHSASLMNFLGTDHWLYDDDLLCGMAEPPLKSRESCTLYMRLDYDSTATWPGNTGEFKCDLVLDSCQAAGAADWPE